MVPLDPKVGAYLRESLQAVTQGCLGSEAAVPISRAIHDELRRLP